jgi:hypothetical protein
MREVFGGTNAERRQLFAEAAVAHFCSEDHAKPCAKLRLTSAGLALKDDLDLRLSGARRMTARQAVLAYAVDLKLLHALQQVGAVSHACGKDPLAIAYALRGWPVRQSITYARQANAYANFHKFIYTKDFAKDEGPGVEAIYQLRAERVNGPNPSGDVGGGGQPGWGASGTADLMPEAARAAQGSTPGTVTRH